MGWQVCEINFSHSVQAFNFKFPTSSTSILKMCMLNYVIFVFDISDIRDWARGRDWCRDRARNRDWGWHGGITCVLQTQFSSLKAKIKKQVLNA